MTSNWQTWASIEHAEDYVQGIRCIRLHIVCRAEDLDEHVTPVDHEDLQVTVRGNRLEITVAKYAVGALIPNYTDTPSLIGRGGSLDVNHDRQWPMMFCLEPAMAATEVD